MPSPKAPRLPTLAPNVAVQLTDVQIISRRKTATVWRLHAGGAQGDGLDLTLTDGVRWHHGDSVVTAPSALWQVARQTLNARAPVHMLGASGELFGGDAQIALDTGRLGLEGPVTGFLSSAGL